MGHEPASLVGKSPSTSSPKRAHLIESTLASILRWTLTGYEIIVSDDCSNDDTRLIQRLAAADARICFLRTPCKLGMSGDGNSAGAPSERP